MISVLCPTRGRPELLKWSIGSLLHQALHPEFIQICYAVDADDYPTCKLMNTSFVRDRDVVHVTPESHGYGGFHLYANALTELAQGKWLMLWNDDALMNTVGWDAIIEDNEPRYILSLRSNHPNDIVAFPIVPKAFTDTIGHYSMNPHNDTWWQTIGDGLDIIRWIDVHVTHDRFDMTGRNNDETYNRTRAQSLISQTSHRFYNDDQHLLEDDKSYIRAYLDREDAVDAHHGDG